MKLTLRRMDLFDTTNYFSGQVSTLAATSPMLLSAACALSAKRISREINSLGNDRLGHQPLDRARQAMPNCDKINWHYETIQFYDQAIQQLKNALMPDSLQSRLKDGEEFPEDIFGVVAIMSMFELMDAPGVEWRVHLGALPLLNEASQTTVNIQSPMDHCRDHGRKAIFWSFARQDVISACETQCFLSVESLLTFMHSRARDTDFLEPRRWHVVEPVRFEYQRLWDIHARPGTKPFQPPGTLDRRLTTGGISQQRHDLDPGTNHQLYHSRRQPGSTRIFVSRRTADNVLGTSGIAPRKMVCART